MESLGSTGIYGVTWRPVSLGVPLVGGKKPTSWRETNSSSINLQVGLLLTYAFIYSDLDVIPTTHFLRPGLDFKIEAELMASKSFLVSLGWASQVYVPQQLGGFGINEQPLDNYIFHVGQAFLKLHFRTPYEATF